MGTLPVSLSVPTSHKKMGYDVYLCFYVCQKCPGKNIPGHFWSPADKYITRGGMFFMFFMYQCLPMNRVTQSKNTTTATDGTTMQHNTTKTL
jgi:hypothetical protein